LQEIMFVLHTGIGWKHLPQEVGFGCGMTAWRRLPSWREAGAWQRLHELLLAGLQAAGEIEWSRAMRTSDQLAARHVRTWVRVGVHQAGNPAVRPAHGRV
jgi:transposase